MNLKANAFLVAVFFGALATSRAELSFAQKEIELHPKSGDAEAVAVFKYENKGKTPVKITAVRTSCGCTAAASKKDEVAPGEKGEVTATFKIGGRTGLQQKGITVETDDPKQPTIGLMLKAMIEQPVEIQPTFVFWQAGEEAKAKSISVKAAKDVSITKLDVTSSSPEFTTEVKKGSAPGEFTINVTPKNTTEAANATLTIKSDLPQPLMATARVTGPAAAAGR